MAYASFLATFSSIFVMCICKLPLFVPFTGIDVSQVRRLKELVAEIGFLMVLIMVTKMRSNAVNGVWPPASPFRSPRGRFQNLLQDEAEQLTLPLPFFILSHLGMWTSQMSAYKKRHRYCDASSCNKFWAENGVRTRGPQLGKLIALKFYEFEITNWATSAYDPKKISLSMLGLTLGLTFSKQRGINNH